MRLDVLSVEADALARAAAELRRDPEDLQRELDARAAELASLRAEESALESPARRRARFLMTAAAMLVLAAVGFVAFLWGGGL